MKSLQIVGNHNYGGGGYLLLRWCRYLRSHGWQVDVLATDPFAVSQFKTIPRVSVIESIYIPREIAPVTDLIAFIQLLILLRRKNYDVVHTYNATSSVLGRIAARLAGVPVILHHQAGWTVTDQSSPLERIAFTAIEYLATLASTRGICVSHAIAQEARLRHIAPYSKLVTICNGIDPQPYIAAINNGSGQKLREELVIPRDHLVIGNAGRLSPQKDNQSLIRALNPLKSLLPEKPFILLFAGDGPDRERLEGLTQSLGLSQQVRFLGFIQDVPAFLAAIDIFISPSYREGMSISLLEAMAAARPIVTTLILQNSELVEHEVTGLLVPPNSPERIAQAIARFKREPGLALRCASAARQRVLERYTIDRMFRETLDLYLDLLGRYRPGILTQQL